MSALRTILKDKGYSRIPFFFTKTNHLEINATINDITGTFILDTGASSSCVGFESVEKFQLHTQASAIKAAGAGATDMDTLLSKNNTMQLGLWSRNRISLILFDLTHVNQALTSHNAEPVDGIIGADILKRGKAIIDYDRKYLYLKN